jgi:hypothetical protein
LKGAEDTFLTLLKLVIAHGDNVNVFVTCWSGSEGDGPWLEKAVVLDRTQQIRAPHN